MQLQDKEKIVFAGDSVTDCGRKRPVGEGRYEGMGDGYVRQIDTILNVCYPEMLFRIINMGISGNTSRDLLNRFDDDVLALCPTRVVILIGINDVWRHFDEPSLMSNLIDKAEYRQNVEKMLDKCVKNDIKVSCMTPYFMELNKDDPMRAMTDEFRAELLTLCREKTVPCVDLQAAFDEYLRFRHPAYIMWDRVHPGNIGGMIIAREYLRSIDFDRKLI